MGQQKSLSNGGQFSLCPAKLPVAAGLGTGTGYESWQLERPGDDEPEQLDGELGGVPNGIHT